MRIIKARLLKNTSRPATKFQACVQLKHFQVKGGQPCLVFLLDTGKDEVTFLRWRWGPVKERGFIFNTWDTIQPLN